MKYIEVSPLPKACQDCHEPDCYECDYAGERWVLPKKQELLLQKKMINSVFHFPEQPSY